MKKTIAFVLAMILALTAFTACLTSASAISITEGIDALRAQWSRGVGPKVNDWDIDYSYYSPIENGADASKKYPLLIFMAGALEGQYEGKELDANNVAELTSDEYQSRFAEGGAFIFIPRAPEEDSLYWDQSKLTPSLFAAIDDFVSKNPNIDTTKIFNNGWCLGGTGAINLVSYKPDYFAGTTIMCPSRSVTTSEAQLLANNNLWFISCKSDTYSNYYLYNYRSWLIMKQHTSDKSKIRLSTFSDVPDTELVAGVPFIDNHDVWSTVANDLDPDENFKGLVTTDGNGKAITDYHLTTWVNSLDNSQSGGTESKVSFIVSMLESFYKYFNENFKAAARLKIFDMLTVIYKAMGWL